MNYSDLILLYDKWLDNDSTPLMLYIDYPMCPNLCKFCVCNPLRYDNKLHDKYIDMITRQLSIAKPLLNKVTPHEVWFGGGTPTLLNHSDLINIVNNIPNWNDIRIKSIESHAYTLDDDYIMLLHKLGFNYINIGVQTFDKQELQRQGRIYVRPEDIKHKIDKLKELGISVNVDIICYLGGVNAHALNQFETDLNIAKTLNPNIIYTYFNKLLLTKGDTKWILKYRMKLLRCANYLNGRVPSSDNYASIKEIDSNWNRVLPIILQEDTVFPTYSSNTVSYVKHDQHCLPIGGVSGHCVYGHLSDKIYYELIDNSVNTLMGGDIIEDILNC